MSRGALALLLCTAFLPTLHARAHAQTVRIRVVDEPTRLGIAHAELTLLREGAQVAIASTDTLGFATVDPPQRGTFTVRVSALGYVDQSREIDLSGEIDDIPAFVLTPAVLTISPIEVAARRQGYKLSSGSIRASQIISGARLVEMRARGLMLEHVIRQISGLRIVYDRGQLCVESTRRTPSFTRPTRQPSMQYRPYPCRMVQLVINGFPYSNGSDFLAHATLDNIESLHYLGPTEAGFHYGMAAAQTGALVLWTRGRGPYVTQNAWIPINRDR